MAKKKAEKKDESVNGNTTGEVVGYEVKDLPKIVVEKKSERGSYTETKNARVVGAVVVKFTDGTESRTLTLHVQGKDFSKYQGEDINWTDNRPVKDEIFKNLLLKIPFGTTVPLKKQPGREGKDNRPFYTIDMEALKIE